MKKSGKLVLELLLVLICSHHCFINPVLPIILSCFRVFVYDIMIWHEGRRERGISHDEQVFVLVLLSIRGSTREIQEGDCNLVALLL